MILRPSLNGNNAVRVVYAILLISLSLISVIPLFPSTANPREFELNNTHADVSLDSSILPMIYHDERVDSDFNGVQDSLEAMISRKVMNESAVLPVVVTLYNPVLRRDLDYFIKLGGKVTHVYRYVTYGFAGIIPVANISRFTGLEKGNLVVIEHDAPIQYHLDVSVPLIRVRPFVWNTYGYKGSSNQSIAIVDTGLDESHPDIGPYEDLNFSKKIVGWYDATADGSLAPQDYGEHGTHVAGIAAGTGAANTLQGYGKIETTFTYRLPPESPGPRVSGYIDYIDVMSPGVVKLNCSWNGDNNVLLALSDPDGREVERTSGTSQPLILTYNTTDTSYPTGRYEVFVGNIAGPYGVPFSCIEAYPYQGLNDGYNLFMGVAPNSKLVGVKVFKNTGAGDLSDLIAGMDWIIENRMKYHIVVASMSLGLKNGATNSTLDQKADTMVNYGIVTTVSAGNRFPDYTIGSPGTAAYVITVAATNDQNSITSYSSNGDASKNEYGLTKPDVAAPGGTFQNQLGNKIVSADSNDVDAGYTGYADRNSNDYQQMAGTSMAAPHVAGLASLIIEALGGWNWTLNEALKVKMIIGMTAFEVQSGEQTNVPSLDRGGKDNKEGYGRISADAAIEAVTMNFSVGELVSETLGFGPSDKKVWARKVSLSANTTYEFHLSVPSSADYDLYLYDGKPDSYGQPVILSKSINASSGAEETIEYTVTNSSVHYILVKWVNGSGTFNLTSTRKEHDVAVLSVVPSTTEAYTGQELNITVVVINEGNTIETFNVTAYYNETAIETKTVIDLAPDANATLTFSWDTRGFSSGNYTVSAKAEAVPGETDVSDNTFIDGIVKVFLAGDVDGDGDVDLDDLYYLLIAYGTKIGDPDYNPDADINEDGQINLDDLYYVLWNYGT